MEEVKLTHYQKYENYQKEYYKKNKEKLLLNASLKVQCEFCQREVCKARLNEHIQTKLCIKNAKIKKLKELRNEELKNI
jgi:hypothetical protein